jgi:hypothetical protein
MRAHRHVRFRFTYRKRDIAALHQHWCSARVISAPGARARRIKPVAFATHRPAERYEALVRRLCARRYASPGSTVARPQRRETGRTRRTGQKKARSKRLWHVSLTAARSAPPRDVPIERRLCVASILRRRARDLDSYAARLHRPPSSDDSNALRRKVDSLRCSAAQPLVAHTIRA